MTSLGGKWPLSLALGATSLPGQAPGVRPPSRPGVVGEFRRGHQFSELLKWEQTAIPHRVSP